MCIEFIKKLYARIRGGYEKKFAEPVTRSVMKAQKKYPAPSSPTIKFRSWLYIAFGFIFLVIWSANLTLENVWSLFISGLFYGIALHVCLQSTEENLIARMKRKKK